MRACSSSLRGRRIESTAPRSRRKVCISLPYVSVTLTNAVSCSAKIIPRSRMPAGYGGLFRTEHVHQLRTEPQAFARGQQRFWPRAKLLGGCSSINAQMYVFLISSTLSPAYSV